MEGLEYGVGYGVSTGAYVFATLALIFLTYIGFKFSKGEFKFRGDSQKLSDEERAKINSQYKFFIILAITFATLMVLLYMTKKGML